MIELDLTTATDVVKGKLVGGADSSVRFRNVSIDSRTLNAGELFFAIRGPHNDGHQYVREAFERRTAGAVVEARRRTELSDLEPLIVVTDTSLALRQLASSYRAQVGARYVGVTGSTGKTTVKEMTNTLLHSAGKPSYMAPGNFNNLFGLPLSLLRMPPNTEIGVFELGISTPGEMAQLAPILKPNVAIITNVSATHLESLQSVERVREEKLEIISHIDEDGAVVIPADDSELLSAAMECGKRLITYSPLVESNADVHPTAIDLDRTTGHAGFTYNGRSVCLGFFGIHQVANSMCSLAACRALGVDVDPRALAGFSSGAGAWRGESEIIRGVTLILDCYNASPSSMRSGLETFMSLNSGAGTRRIAVVGDMLELGASAQVEHEKIGGYLAMRFAADSESGEFPLAALIAVGDLGLHIASTLEIAVGRRGEVVCAHVATPAEAGERLLEITRPGDLVYFKASRGINLEKAVAVFKEGSGS